MSNALTLNKERDYWFDNAKAFLILTVVIGHLGETVLAYSNFVGGNPLWLEVLYKVAYAFHMPAFLAISGRFAKKHIDTNDRTSIINKLIIPYIIIQTTMLLFNLIVGYSHVSNFSFLKPLFGLWYIFTIAVYELITPYIAKFKIFMPLSIVLALLLSFRNDALYGGLQRIVGFYPFFLFGYYTATHDFKYCKKLIFRIISVLAFVGIIVYVFNFKDMVPVSLLTCKRVYNDAYDLFKMSGPHFFTFLVIRYIIGFAFFLFTLGISSTKKNIFTRLGQNSVYIYILHLFLIVFLRSMDRYYGWMDVFGNDALAIVLLLAGIPYSFLLTTPFIKKITNWMIAPKITIPK